MLYCLAMDDLILLTLLLTYLRNYSHPTVNDLLLFVLFSFDVTMSDYKRFITTYFPQAVISFDYIRSTATWPVFFSSDVKISDYERSTIVCFIFFWFHRWMLFRTLIFWMYEETNVCKIFCHIKDQCFLFSGVSIQRRISGTIGASKISEIRATKDWKLCHRVLQGSRFKDRRCFEQNYTARAHSNRCSSENIQEATSWPGNTTVSKVSTIRKRRESEKRTSFVDRKWRSELKTFLLSFFVVFFSVFFLFHTVVLSFFLFSTSCIFHVPFTMQVLFCGTSKYFRRNRHENVHLEHLLWSFNPFLLHCCSAFWSIT